MLGAALGTILLPSLAKYHAKGEFDEYSRLLDWGLEIDAPAGSAGGRCASDHCNPLIATLFHHGAFTDVDVFKTRDALVAYSFGLLGLILVQGPGPWFLCPTECAHTGQDRAADLICHPGPQSGLDRLAEACRPGAVHRTGCLRQCRIALPNGFAPACDLCAATRLAGLFPQTGACPLHNGVRTVVCKRQSKSMAAMEHLDTPTTALVHRYLRRRHLFRYTMAHRLPPEGFPTPRRRIALSTKQRSDHETSQ